MPELPEVETIRRQLSAKITGKAIVAVEPEKIRKEKMDSVLAKNLPLRVQHIHRRGKALVFDCGKYSLLARLGMTGSFNEKKQKHLRATLGFDDGSALYFHDARKFGSLRMLATPDVEKELLSLGPEPLAEDFTLDSFRQLLQRHSDAGIKPALMDQKIIAGIGNIYAQEMLYRAGIRPQRKIKTLSPGEMELLYAQMQKTLQEAIEHCGTTFSDYRHTEGEGSFQNFLCVYGKTYCPKKHALVKIKLGGRGTSYCRGCQR